MAKCSACQSRKGKRRCQAKGGEICPQCCGELRTREACTGCVFFADKKRDYGHLPYFATSELAGNSSLSNELALPIELALCRLDNVRGKRMTDAEAIAILELLLDRYAFDENPASPDYQAKVDQRGAGDVVVAVGEALAEHPREDIVKALGAIRRTAIKRGGEVTSPGARTHLDFLHRYMPMSI